MQCPLVFGCLLLAAAAVSDECVANPDGTNTCGADQSALLQSKVQVSSDELQADEEFAHTRQVVDAMLSEHVYGPFPATTSLLTYYKGWAQGAIDTHLARVIPAEVLAEVDAEELPVVYSSDPIEPPVSTLESDMDTESEALSAGMASELFESAMMDQCPDKVLALTEETEFEVVQAEPADSNGVRHVLLKRKDGQLQYMASHRSPDGEHRALVTYPSACSTALALLDPLEPDHVVNQDDPLTTNSSSIGGERHELALTDQLVLDCETLFKRTVEENCGKSVDLQVLRAKELVINGLAVQMQVQVCRPGAAVGSSDCQPHRPHCAFEVSTDHTDAVLLQQEHPIIQAEQDGLTATLKLSVPVCDVDTKPGLTLDEAEEDGLLLQYSMGDNSGTKGFEHVYDNYPVMSALEVDTPAEVDFRVKYPSCYPSLSGKNIGTETVRNQGTCGSCWAFASATSAMANMCISGGPSSNSMFSKSDRFEVSVQKIMSCLPKGRTTAQGCKGGNMQGFDSEVKTWGFTKERDNLYKCGKGDPKKHFASKSDCKAFPWGGLCQGNANPDWWWRGSARVSGEDNMKSYIAGKQSLYVSMDIYSNFFSLRSGVYNKITGGKQGGHAMSACGYGIEGGEKYWLLQNSWGSSGWGDQGYGKVLRGTNIAGVETNAMTAFAWATGGTAPPCDDSTTGSGISSTGRAPYWSCSKSKRYCHWATVAGSCPKTCNKCAGTNGAGTKPAPAPTPAPTPKPTPGTNSKCCAEKCARGNNDCAAGLFCCPNHNMCMDKTTYSTRGPTCTSCKNGGATPAPTAAPTRAPAPGPAPGPAPTKAPAPGPAPIPGNGKGKLCGFERASGNTAYCGVWKNAKGDKFDWTHKMGGTSSGGTGPSKAQEGNFYLYIETSYPRRNGDNAILEYTTPALGSGGYLEFKYNMYGRSTGSLKVKGNGAVLWEKSGQQTTAATWGTARVDFDKHQLTGPVKLEFEGTRGSSYTGDIAIDAVTLYEGGSSPAPGPAPATTQAPTPATTQAPTPATTQAPAPASTTTTYQRYTTAPPTPAPTPAPTQAPTPATTQAPTPATTQAPSPATTQAPSPTPTPATTPAPAPAPAPTPPAPPGSNQDVVNRLSTAEGLLRKILSKIR